MTKIRRFDYGAHDDLAQSFSEIVDSFMGAPFVSTFSARGRFVNEEDYDILPKKHTIERKIKGLEEELERLRQRKENDLKAYESREKSLLTEIDNYKRKLSP